MSERTPGLEDSAIENYNGLTGYTIGEVIGEGGFCQVRAGVHEASGQQVAMKVIDKVCSNTLTMLDR